MLLFVQHNLVTSCTEGDRWFNSLTAIDTAVDQMTKEPSFGKIRNPVLLDEEELLRDVLSQQDVYLTSIPDELRPVFPKAKFILRSLVKQRYHLPVLLFFVISFPTATTTIGGLLYYLLLLPTITTTSLLLLLGFRINC